MGAARSQPKNTISRIVGRKLGTLKLLHKILLGLGCLVGALVVVAGVAYAADAPLDATITEKNCAASTATVSIVTDLLGIRHTLDMAHDQCGAIQEGNFVRYHVRSGHTIIYASEGGSCMFDSATIACL